MREFTHLHNHTHYSLLDAACTPKQLVNKAKEFGHKSLALTDHGVMFGIMEFYELAKKEGVKPLIGFEAYVANGSRFERTAGQAKSKKKNYFHLILIAKNNIGYKNLVKLTSLAHTEGFYYKPRIDKELLKQYHEGIIATSACINGVINAHLIRNDYEKALEEAAFYQELFGEDFYIELQNHSLPEDEIVLRDAPKIAAELGIKLVATNDIHYIEKDDAVSHNVYLLIKSSSADTKPDIEDLRYRVPEMYYKSTEEMEQLFADFPEALESTGEIADKCDVKFEQQYFLPDFPLPDDTKAKNHDDYLRELTYKGLEKRYSEITDAIKERVEFELNVIISMGFSGYFLIVQDFIAEARRMNVRVGPGRGSAAGSIVAYALGITNVDPLKYNLLFERFLNPERVSMPDIDIDFSDDKREEVVKYVKRKYGEKSVAQIVTFNKLSSRAVLSDVGRVLGYDFKSIKKITSPIPSILGKVLTLKEALDLPDLKDFKNSSDPLDEKLRKHSFRLEGLFRSSGTHAAGVVIAPGDVDEYVPIYYSPSSKHLGVDVATQYSMKYLEKAGLIKMDFLGLKTLSIIDNILEMVKVNHGIDIDIDNIDLDDKKTYDIFCNGKTLGVFQFESDGMRKYLMQLKPQNIEEIAAMNALYRPGPMDNIPEYIERKFGKKKIEYLHPKMEEALKNTYGIIVYQEQVMQLARDIAGFSFGQADVLRRAMGKKDEKLMQQQKSVFIEGALKNGFDEKTANDIFDLINKFASYGFNKSHSLAYSLLAYQLAYLKAHYPAEFYAANMTAKSDEHEKLVKFVEEARDSGIEVLPPDVNNSTDKFNAKDNKIYFSFAAIKNVGIAAAQGIVKAREDGPFTSLFDFVTRIDNKLVNRKVLEALIAVGAFDSLNAGNRATLFNAIDVAINFGKQSQQKSGDNMDSLFTGEVREQTVIVPKLEYAEEWSDEEKFRKEKELLDFYVSGSPMDKYKNFINELATLRLCDTDSPLIQPEIRSYSNGNGYNQNPKVMARVCGILDNLRFLISKKNKKFAVGTLSDFYASAELLFGYQLIESNAKTEASQGEGLSVKKDDIILCIGSASVAQNGIKIIVDEYYSIFDAIDKFGRGFEIRLNDDIESSENLKKLAELCTGTSNKKDFHFVIHNEKTNELKKYVSEDLDFPVTEYSINKLLDIFGSDNVHLIRTL